MIEYSEIKLRDIVNKSKTYREVLNKFERNTSGASYKQLHKVLNKWNIDTSHFYNRSELMIRNNGIYSRKENNEMFSINSIGRSSIKNRILNDNLIEYKCKKCGQDEWWNSEKISLILDHINGIGNDNRLENLRFLCPNCNATLPTHCKGSKGLEKTIIIKRKRKISDRSHTRKIKRPSYEQLKNEIESTNYSAVGRKYGVSDNAIRKWIKNYENKNF